MHPNRQLPKLATRTFRAQWKKRATSGRAPDPAKPRVILWVDTFNNYFTPKPLLAAAALLQKSGYEVMLSPIGLCCGRPYYDFGRLTEARAHLTRCIEGLVPYLDTRTWVVGIEPSCLSVFREEMMNLFPGHAQAKHLKEQTVTLGAFLNKHGFPQMKFDREVVVHGHCHHKSVLGMDGEKELLKSCGNVDFLDSGCCGMAGAFGYEKDKYTVSRTIAEQGIVPLLREHPKALVVADGFSCRHQIQDFAGRETLTTPELLLQSMGGG